MIEAVFHTKQHRYCSFQIEGHETYGAEQQFGLVCASVSVIAQSIVNGIEAHCSDTLSVSVNEERGLLSAEITSGPSSDEAQLLLEVLYDSLCNISQGYPGVLHVSSKAH